MRLHLVFLLFFTTLCTNFSTAQLAKPLPPSLLGKWNMPGKLNPGQTYFCGRPDSIHQSPYSIQFNSDSTVVFNSPGGRNTARWGVQSLWRGELTMQIFSGDSIIDFWAIHYADSLLLTGIRTYFNPELDTNKEHVFVVVEQGCEFAGGDDALLKRLTDSLHKYEAPIYKMYKNKKKAAHTKPSARQEYNFGFDVIINNEGRPAKVVFYNLPSVEVRQKITAIVLALPTFKPAKNMARPCYDIVRFSVTVNINGKERWLYIKLVEG